MHYLEQNKIIIVKRDEKYYLSTVVEYFEKDGILLTNLDETRCIKNWSCYELTEDNVHHVQKEIDGLAKTDFFRLFRNGGNQNYHSYKKFMWKWASHRGLSRKRFQDTRKESLQKNKPFVVGEVCLEVHKNGAVQFIVCTDLNLISYLSNDTDIFHLYDKKIPIQKMSDDKFDSIYDALLNSLNNTSNDKKIVNLQKFEADWINFKKYYKKGTKKNFGSLGDFGTKDWEKKVYPSFATPSQEVESKKSEILQKFMKELIFDSSHQNSINFQQHPKYYKKEPNIKSDKKVKIGIGEEASKSVFKLSEDKIIKELYEYIKKTYSEHYASGDIQTIEYLMYGKGAEEPIAENFCIGNLIKYAMRYGEKSGKNRKDLIKIIHYGILLVIAHDNTENRINKARS